VHAFTQHYRKFARMKRFPDGQASFARLGVRAGEESVTFDADAPDAVIRNAITAPRKRSANRRDTSELTNLDCRRATPSRQRASPDGT